MSDHFPTCPSCGTLCGKLARVCADCGAYLYPPTMDDRIARNRLITDGLAALRREEPQPRKGSEV